MSERTGLVTVPHASNIVGKENDVTRITTLAHAVGARVIVDGVSFAPHSLPDVAAIGADVYLFSLYKTYSVHQGLMVVRAGLMAELPNQSHFFNDNVADKRLNPAGPDHAQVASAGCGARLRRGAAPSPWRRRRPTDSARAAAAVSALWREHEDSLTPALLDVLADRDDVRLIGPATLDATSGHRCPTVAFSPLAEDPQVVAHELVQRGRPDELGSLLRRSDARWRRHRPGPWCRAALVRALHVACRSRAGGRTRWLTCSAEAGLGRTNVRFGTKDPAGGERRGRYWNNVPILERCSNAESWSRHG